MISYINQPAGIPAPGIDTVNSEYVNSPGHGLSSECISSPHGFIVTAFAVEEFLTYNSLHYPLHNLMQSLNTTTYSNLADIADEAASLLGQAKIPHGLKLAIIRAYRELGINEPVSVNTQSAASTNENGQNVSGEKQVLAAIKKCFITLYAKDAIKYRQDNGLVHDKAALKVTVQKMRRLPESVQLIDPQSLN